MNPGKALNVLNDWKNDWSELQYYVSAAVEHLEPLERLERLEPDFKTGHCKIQNLLLEVTFEAVISIRDTLAPITSTKRKCPAIDDHGDCRNAAGPLDT